MTLFSHPIWQSQLWWLSLTLFFIGILGSWLYVLRHKAKLKLEQRVDKYFEQGSNSRLEHDDLFIDNQSQSKEIRKLTTLLHKAGFFQPHAVYYLISAKLGLGLITAVSLYFTLGVEQALTNQQLLLIAALSFAANLIPDHYLQNQADNRQKQVLKSLPDSLDLIVICLESGATFERSLAMVSEQLEEVYPVLAQEWQQTLRELKLNPDREVAFDNLVMRCPSAEMSALVAAVKQAESLGSPLAQTLRNFAVEMRQLTKLTLEEKIGKLSTKITLPMLVLVFLPLLVIILAPIGYNLLVALKELG